MGPAGQAVWSGSPAGCAPSEASPGSEGKDPAHVRELVLSLLRTIYGTVDRKVKGAPQGSEMTCRHGHGRSHSASVTGGGALDSGRRVPSSGHRAADWPRTRPPTVPSSGWPGRTQHLCLNVSLTAAAVDASAFPSRAHVCLKEGVKTTCPPRQRSVLVGICDSAILSRACEERQPAHRLG